MDASTGAYACLRIVAVAGEKPPSDVMDGVTGGLTSQVIFTLFIQRGYRNAANNLGPQPSGNGHNSWNMGLDNETHWYAVN